ncbi:hypothetical protein, partial [Proteus terrae]
DTTSTLPIRDCIKDCVNKYEVTRNSILINEFNNIGLLSNNHNNQEVNEPELSGNVNALNEIDMLAKELNNLDDSIRVKNIKQLPDWITSSGKKELNTNQKLYFSTEKKRSFKNLLKPIISPFKFINRSLLPIRINYENLNINEGVDTFKFDNI